jgi:hypothetical protein
MTVWEEETTRRRPCSWDATPSLVLSDSTQQLCGPRPKVIECCCPARITAPLDVAHGATQYGVPYERKGVGAPLTFYRLSAVCQPTIKNLVAGAGFEPATFGLCAKRNNAPERSASINFAFDSTHLRTDSPFQRPFVSPNVSPNRGPWLLDIRLTASSAHMSNMSAAGWRTSISGICSWLTATRVFIPYYPKTQPSHNPAARQPSKLGP